MATPGEVAIRPLVSTDVPAAARALAAAFDTDPLIRFLYPTPRRRRMTSCHFFAAMMRDALPFGEVHAAFIRDTVVGTTVWLPPGTYPPGPRREFRLILASVSSVLSWSRLPEQLRYLAEVPKHHLEARHWYLALAGVHPTWQSTGIGRALLDPVHARLDAAGEVAFLETQTPSNVGWYGRQGYDVLEEFQPCTDGPVLWTLSRSPRPPLV